MATRQDALNWFYSENGGVIDFDGRYGAQCVDYFNLYYKFLVGHSPYSDGYGVNGAKDLWNVPTDRFTKIKNNPNDPNQLPQTGDILIYGKPWGKIIENGVAVYYGHVEMVLSADRNGVNVSAQNSKGQYVAMEFRPWSRVVGGLIGWMSFNSFAPEPVATVVPPPEPTPAPPVIVNDPLPPVVSEVPNEPTPTPAPVETPPVVPEAPEVPVPTPVPPVPQNGTPEPKVSPSLKSLWEGLPDGVRRIIHTTWQVTVPTLISGLYMASSPAEVKAAFIAAGTIALATVKAAVLGKK